MTKTSYIERMIFTITYWLPKLVALQFLWLVHILPIGTMAVASRSLVLAIHRCQQEKVENVFLLYRHIFQIQMKNTKKRNFLLGVYSLLMVFDIWFFFAINKPYGYIVSYSLVIASYFILLLFIYHTLLNAEKGVRTNLITTFYLLFKFPRFVILHALLTVGSYLGLLWIGPVYVLLLSISVFFFLHYQIFCLKISFYEKSYPTIVQK